MKSYRQLPVNFYQIQTKFRDEIRPRFGVMRAREFTMKDAYSFHLDEASLEQGYQAMFAAYSRIFTRIDLRFRAVAADTGAIGGSASHEFQVLADSGEDAIAFSDGATTPPTSSWRRRWLRPARAPRRARRCRRWRRPACAPSRSSQPSSRSRPRSAVQRRCWSRARTAAWWRSSCAATTS